MRIIWKPQLPFFQWLGENFSWKSTELHKPIFLLDRSTVDPRYNLEPGLIDHPKYFNHNARF